MTNASAHFLSGTSLRAIDLARAAKVDKATVTRWLQGRIPAERVLEVERLTGVSRHSLRPDIYPLPATSPGGGEPGAGEEPVTSPAPEQHSKEAA